MISADVLQSPLLATRFSALAMEDLDRLFVEELAFPPPVAVEVDLGVLAVELLIPPVEESEFSPAAIEDLGVPDIELSPELVASALVVGAEMARSAPEEGECINETFSETFRLNPSTLNWKFKFLGTVVCNSLSMIRSSILGGYKVISLTARLLFSKG